jgi:hypothetical protein
MTISAEQTAEALTFIFMCCAENLGLKLVDSATWPCYNLFVRWLCRNYLICLTASNRGLYNMPVDCVDD